MFETLLAIGGLGFWSLIAIETILLLCWIEWEYSGLATLSVLVTAAIMQFACHVDMIGYVQANPQIVLYGLLGYFLTGTVWSIMKWWFFVKGERRRYNEFKAEFLYDNGIKDGILPDNLKPQFLHDLPTYGSDKIEIRPQVGNHKARIYLWIAYWPWSMLWTIVNDPIRRICREIYEQIKSNLQKISDSVWAGTEQDFVQKDRK
jgi:hypothetical protein